MQHTRETQASPTPNRRHLEKGIVLAILLSFFCLAGMYNISVPLWESPDEPAHFDYIAHLVQQKRLPRITAGQLNESHQPPLYYALAALWTLPADLNDPTGKPQLNPQFVHAGNGGGEVNVSEHPPAETRFPYRGWARALHLVRLFSTLLGVGSLYFTYLLARMVFPQRVEIPLLATALVAFNPQFIFISASANNDNLLIFTASALLLNTARLLKSNTLAPPSLKATISLSLWALALVLTKMLGLAIVACVSLILFFAIWHRHGWSATLKFCLRVALIVSLGSLWWWLRNQIYYGDPLAYKIYQEVFAANLRSTPLALEEWRMFLRTQFLSFWGVFGWMNIMPPTWFYNFYRYFCGATLLGNLIGCASKRFRTLATPLLGLLIAAIVAQEAYLISIIQGANNTMWQGRYLFPTIAPLAILLAYGLTGWLPRKLAPLFAALVGLSFAGMALYVPLKVIQPAYQPRLAATEIAAQTALDAAFGEMLQLRGYDIEQDALSVKITLYWEALRPIDFDYSVFVHCIDANGELIGQQDHAPGRQVNYLPTAWQPGEAIADTHRVSLLRAPQGPLYIRVGAYNWATGTRLAVTQNGQASGDFLEFPVEKRASLWPFVLGGGGLVSIGVGVTAFLYLKNRDKQKQL